jgi:hypothetical protein
MSNAIRHLSTWSSPSETPMRTHVSPLGLYSRISVDWQKACQFRQVERIEHNLFNTNVFDFDAQGCNFACLCFHLRMSV